MMVSLSMRLPPAVLACTFQAPSTLRHPCHIHRTCIFKMDWYYQPYEGYTDFYSLESWTEIGSQPSSSSLSSINDDIVTTGLRVQHDPRQRRRKTLRPGAPSNLGLTSRTQSVGATSSQEEYEESESEPDPVMTSSGEGPHLAPNVNRNEAISNAQQHSSASDSAPQESSDDENRTAINHPLSHNDGGFTPQPNAFSHPPSSSHMRNASYPVAGSYFPSQRPTSRPTTRHSLSSQPDQRSHMPQNLLSPSYNATAHHDKALRASLSTLLSCAAAARGLKSDAKRRQQQAQTTQPRGQRVEPMSFNLVRGSDLPAAGAIREPPVLQEPTFQPTIRRTSTSTNSTSPLTAPDHFFQPSSTKDAKRKSRTASKDRHSKKVRRSSSADELAHVSPTLLTWVVSAGVVVVLSALSFSAGYSLGKEAGRFEVAGVGGWDGVNAGDEVLRGCAREAGRSSLGLKRSLARSAVQV